VKADLRTRLLLSIIVAASACKREERRFEEGPPAAATAERVTMSDLHPAGASTPTPTTVAYVENAWAISEGKRMYQAFNCVGCHANGGGGMGPALMDDKWIYGSEPSNIFATIVEGRPNGMPSYRGKIRDYQVWQIAAYVRSLSGLVPKDAAGGRSDHMYVKPQEQDMPPPAPRKTGSPPSS
jgi:cytochrome c oxidase cbb3-type subunit III